MITSGHLIGQIIDELSAISHQVETRTKLGLTDLNRHLETFFQHMLNQCLGISLRNLNVDRTNSPGLDLGDESTKIAFQITSTKTSKKVNETLEKITADQLSKYESIRVFIIGKKQSSYELDKDLTERCRFKEADIMDVFDLCKYMIDLPLDRLKLLADYITAEVARVKIELEIPTAEGKYSTEIIDYIEKHQNPILGDCRTYWVFQKQENTRYSQSLEEAREDLLAFAVRLSRLPRITREFLALLLERHDSVDPLFINHDKLRRICRWPDIDGELRLLQAEELVRIDQHDESNLIPKIMIFISGTMGYGKKINHDFHLQFMDYMSRKALCFQRVISQMNFEGF
jgi:hypothetical protein